MNGGVVCYIERAQSGTLLRRVRLVAIGLSRSWSAPEPGGDLSDSVPAGSPGGSPALASVRSAARWVAETLQSAGIKRLACVCVDADGSICAWLSAPSAEQQVVEASVLQAGGDPEQQGGLNAGRLLAMATPGGGLGPGADTSIQALATLDPEPAANGASPKRRLLGRRSPADQARLTQRHRYAVLAVPDAPVRVFLDELDTRGVEVRAVKTLWHAMAGAWSEPPTAAAAARSTSIVSADSTTAVVLIEPAPTSSEAGPLGRLVWAWARAGDLLAGGTMRLKSLSPPRSASPSDAAPGDLATLSNDAEPAPDAPDEPRQIEFSRADAGRLAVDWLSWSAQIGHCPGRIVLLAPPEATDEDGSGPASLGRHLAAAWPNATIDAAVLDDPTSATIARLAGVRKESEADPSPDSITADTAADGHAALMSLSARPGRVDRRMHIWAAAGLVAATVVIGVLGWRIREAADRTDDRTAQAAKTTTELLTGIEPIIPGVSRFPARQQLEALEARRTDLREQARKVRPPKPVLEEMLRLLGALSVGDEMDVVDLKIGFVNGSATLEVPEGPKAAEVGPRVLEKLRETRGALSWQGQSASFSSQPGKRRYVLNGVWPVEDDGGPR